MKQVAISEFIATARMLYRSVMSSARRIGIHLSSSGGVWKAVERAVAIGANTFQIFSSSPRMWRAPVVKPADAEKLKAARKSTGVGPLVIHVNYLVNVCSQNEETRQKSIAAFRGEVERGLALGAEGLVLHPGSWRGLTRERGLTLASESIEQAIEGLDLAPSGAASKLHILIENTAGAEFSLGGSFEQVAELIALLKKHAPVAACLDTCHTHVAGYDIVSETGYEDTMRQVEATIGHKNVHVWHCNDAKAACGSKLDRHEHIGEGMIGSATFRRLLHDPRFAHAAFIAETPVDTPGDDERDVAALLHLAR
jgi:deoxyribonuclease-4